MSLKRNVRKSIEGGSTSHATVEANNNGLITVKLLGSNSRMTNLEYIGSISPQVGDKVVIDYSAGDKPIVRVSQTQLYSGERYMNETMEPLEMQPPLPGPPDDGGIIPGGLDIGMAITTKGGQFPNEPHAPDTAWTQYWGINSGNWESAIYDSGNFDDGDVSGTQSFLIPQTGAYLVSLVSNADIDTVGILRARVMRGYGTDPDVPFLKGVASNSGYGSYHNMDINKIMYLPEGESISVELMYTGSGSEYALKNTDNPLKWVVTQNEFIFKIQLLTEALNYVEPDIPTFIPAQRYWWGEPATYTITAPGSGGSVYFLDNQVDWLYDLKEDNHSAIVYPDASVDPFHAWHVGMLVTLHWTNYGGDVWLIHGTNTNYMKKFHDWWTDGENEMYPGETIFAGSAGASAWSGWPIDPDTDHEGGGFTYPPGPIPPGKKHRKDFRLYHQIGGAGPQTSFTVQPLWYGYQDEDDGWPMMQDPP